MAINETMQYTYRVAGPKIWQFFFPMEVKSFVTHPSPGLTLKGPGFYEVSGLAYSGNGRIARVMVSADGGKSWGEAALDAPVLSKALTRFRMPWRWDGQPVVLQSRAWDEAGNVQPTRGELLAERGEPKVNVPVTAFPMGHMNMDHELGHRHQRGGQACLCVRGLCCRHSPRMRTGRSRGRCRGWARSRQTRHRGRSRAVGHQHRTGRRRIAARQRHAGSGRRRLRAEVRAVPRQGGPERPQCRAQRVRNAPSPITCRTRPRSLTSRGGRCRGRSQNRSAMTRSMR